ncbi:hypothetical protein ACOME3_004278 [Neoechinorhynchus agilis]
MRSLSNHLTKLRLACARCSLNNMEFSLAATAFHRIRNRNIWPEEALSSLTCVCLLLIIKICGHPLSLKDALNVTMFTYRHEVPNRDLPRSLRQTERSIGQIKQCVQTAEHLALRLLSFEVPSPLTTNTAHKFGLHVACSLAQHEPYRLNWTDFIPVLNTFLTDLYHDDLLVLNYSAEDLGLVGLYVCLIGTGIDVKSNQISMESYKLSIMKNKEDREIVNGIIDRMNALFE